MLETRKNPPRKLQTDQLRFSFVIANFNYGRFLTRAIDSALGQDWEDIEVIVVDDGSTDDSKSVIDAYGEQITAIFQPNSGQRIANNAGFAHSTGDVVVFLDADDVVDPHFARAVAQEWQHGLSKVQVLMERVDAEERPLGSLVPPISHAPAPAAIRKWAAKTSEYPTPPGSGNAYSRQFLDRLFPLGPEHDGSTDSTCLALAPFLGDVLTIAQPLALYRQHGSNDSDLFADRKRFGREVGRAMLRQRSAERICEEAGVTGPEPDCLRLGWHLLQLRIASLRTDPHSHPFPGDTRPSMLYDCVRSILAGGFESPQKRILALLWSLATLFAPHDLAAALIRRRFSV
ncbi:glycosyltransferase family 2 protein [Tsuneonella mangrovi]|uniref:glycosyltransferase family 2 protein n=1 Tax=Tsuneonella mangrovi TaxID=1982042 RepID=UPI000BA1F0B4|nr:glycosyltransferase family 2 protein [Tsuneonella mangrovi]